MINRRRFLRETTLAVSTAAAVSTLRTAPAQKAWGAETASKTASDFTVRPGKAVIDKLPDAADVARMKSIGLDGMEVRGPIELSKAREIRKEAEKQDFHIHSVMGGGSVERLAAAAELGATAALVVPGRVSGVQIPQPWEFCLQFDEKTNRLIEVVDGDNALYANYIAEHNKQMENARKLVETLMPAAEKYGVVIALENVWNNMWVHPAFAANFIKSFNSPWVQAYFDIGNNVKYYPNPEDWFDHLDGKIARIHLKDFKLNDDGRGGKFVPIMEGSVDWLKIRQKMIDFNFNTWVTVELDGGFISQEEQAKRMNLILDGKPLN